MCSAVGLQKALSKYLFDKRVTPRCLWSHLHDIIAPPRFSPGSPQQLCWRTDHRPIRPTVATCARALGPGDSTESFTVSQSLRLHVRGEAVAAWAPPEASRPGVRTASSPRVLACSSLWVCPPLLCFGGTSPIRWGPPCGLTSPQSPL